MSFVSQDRYKEDTKMIMDLHWGLSRTGYLCCLQEQRLYVADIGGGTISYFIHMLLPSICLAIIGNRRLDCQSRMPLIALIAEIIKAWNEVTG